MPSIAMTQFFGGFQFKRTNRRTSYGWWNFILMKYLCFSSIWLGRVFIVLFPFSSFSLWTPTQTVTGGLSSKTMTCCYRLIRTVGEWTKSHQLFMAVTTCILNLDKQTNSSNLCLQIVDLKLYGINVPGILQT